MKYRVTKIMNFKPYQINWVKSFIGDKVDCLAAFGYEKSEFDLVRSYVGLQKRALEVKPWD